MENIVKYKEKYEIPSVTQNFVLQMCWALHDAQWYLKTKKKYGPEDANFLNRRVVFSIGKIEARYVLNALSIKKESIKSIEDITKIILTIRDVLFPKIMKTEHYIESNTIGYGVVKKCFIWEEVKKAHGEDEYECSCMDRTKGWLAAMGVDADVETQNRFSDGDNLCKFKFKFSDGDNLCKFKFI